MLESRANQATLIRILALCGIIGPIIFAISVTVAGSIYEGYSHSAQAISELGGVDAEHPWLQQTTFFVVGSLFVALAVGLHKGIGGGRGSKIAPALIVMFGISSGFGNGIFPCDSGCDGQNFTGFMHNLTGVAGFIAAIISVFMISRRLKDLPEWSTVYALSRVFRFAVLLGLVSWIVVAKIIEVDELNGVLQRLFIGVWFVWAEIMAIRLFTLSLQRTRREPTLAAG